MHICNKMRILIITLCNLECVWLTLRFAIYCIMCEKLLDHCPLVLLVKYGEGNKDFRR